MEKMSQELYNYIKMVDKMTVNVELENMLKMCIFDIWAYIKLHGLIRSDYCNVILMYGTEDGEYDPYETIHLGNPKPYMTLYSDGALRETDYILYNFSMQNKDSIEDARIAYCTKNNVVIFVPRLLFLESQMYSYGMIEAIPTILLHEFLHMDRWDEFHANDALDENSDITEERYQKEEVYIENLTDQIMSVHKMPLIELCNNHVKCQPTVNFIQRNNPEDYFKSKGDMYAYTLKYLDGTSRQEVLGIEKKHYTQRNNVEAVKWHKNIVGEIIDAPAYKDAIDKADQILKRMKGEA